MGRDKKAQKYKKPEKRLLKKHRIKRDKLPTLSEKSSKDEPLVSISLDTVLTESDVKSLLRILSSSSEDQKR
jgi:hypothetical protein